MHTQDKLILILFIIFFLSLLYLLSSILTPFFIGAFLAYLVNPLVSRLMTFRLSRILSVSIISFLLFFIITLILVLLVPFIQKQANALIENIPTMLELIQSKIYPYFTYYFGFSIETIDLPAIKNFMMQHLSKANNVVNSVLLYAIHSGLRIIEIAMNILLIPIVTLYLLADWPLLISNIKQLFPQRFAATLIALMQECDEILSAFLRGQLLVMLALATLYTTGLSLMGLQMGLLIGLIAGILSFVPYLGLIVGIGIASLMALIQFNTFSAVLMVLAIFTLGQILDHVFLTPKLVGNRIGLHPVAVIFAILAGGKLFGFTGILLALPVAALIMVWVRYFLKHYYEPHFHPMNK